MLTVALAVSISSCNDYYDDGGTHNPYVQMTTVQFLEQHPNFDTTVRLIRAVPGMEDLLNSDGITFMAPSNYAVYNHIAGVRSWPGRSAYTLDSLLADTHNLERYFKRTIVNGYLYREDLLIVPYQELIDQTTHLNLLNEEIAVYNQEIGKGSMTNEYVKNVYFGRKIGEGWDDKDFSTTGDANWRTFNLDDSAIITTSGIITTNGVIHVLSPNSTFGFTKLVGGTPRY